MQNEQLLEETNALRKAFNILLPHEIARLVGEGALAREAMQASYKVQCDLVCHHSEHMRWLDHKVYEKNLEWNIAEGLLY